MNTRRVFSCFDSRFLALMIGAAALLTTLAFVARGYPAGSAARLALAAGQALVLGGAIVASVRAIERLDELDRLIHLQAIAVSFTLTAILGSALNAFERAGLPLEGWESFLWGFMAITWFVSALFIQRRYR